MFLTNSFDFFYSLETNSPSVKAPCQKGGAALGGNKDAKIQKNTIHNIVDGRCPKLSGRKHRICAGEY